MFINEQINIENLPKTDAIQYIKVEKSYFYILLFNLIAIYSSLIVGITLFTFLIYKGVFQKFYWLFFAILIFALVVQIIFCKMGFSKRKYAIRDKDITYSEGLITNTTTTLPFNRVQHIEIKRSFLSRKLNLSTLNIYSAGESGGDLSIKGLPKDVAEKMYTFLTNILNERL